MGDVREEDVSIPDRTDVGTCPVSIHAPLV